MVRKISIKRKHMNQRTKSKRSFRKTKKLVRKSRSRSQSRRRMKSLVGGGAGCSTSGAAAVAPSYISSQVRRWECTWNGKKLISKRANVDGKTEERSVDGGNIGILREYVVKNIQFITDSMEDESQTIALFEYIRIDVTDIEIKTFGELTTSLLLYVFNKSCQDKPYKLIWWLIEHGADVNHRNSLPRTTKVNVFTILGDVIQLLTNFNFFTTPIMKSDGTWNLINLTDFYNIVYTLVLLLSRGANMQMNIVNWDSQQYTKTTTALEMLKTKDEAWMTQMKELSKNLNSMSERSTFDRESLEAFESDTALKAKTDIMIQKIKILTDPFNSVLDLIKAPPQEDKRLLQDVKKLCIDAMGEVDRLQPHVKVVWMIESVPGNNLFVDLDEKSSNVFEGSFKAGDNEVVSGTLLEKPDSNTDFRTMKFTTYEYVTVGESGKPLPLPSPSGSKESAPASVIVERRETVKRIWRDIRVSIDPSELSDLQLEGTLTKRDPDVTWFYVSDDSTKVKSYSPEIAQVIENASMKGLQSVEYSPKPGVNWVFDLKNMRQTNTKTFSTRNIKRGKVKWEWESDDGQTFNQFQPYDARLLEENFNNDSKSFKHPHNPWNFNLVGMIQTNTTHGGSSRRIRRTIVGV